MATKDFASKTRPSLRKTYEQQQQRFVSPSMFSPQIIQPQGSPQQSVLVATAATSAHQPTPLTINGQQILSTSSGLGVMPQVQFFQAPTNPGMAQMFYTQQGQPLYLNNNNLVTYQPAPTPQRKTLGRPPNKNNMTKIQPATNGQATYQLINNNSLLVPNQQLASTHLAQFQTAVWPQQVNQGQLMLVQSPQFMPMQQTTQVNGQAMQVNAAGATATTPAPTLQIVSGLGTPTGQPTVATPSPTTPNGTKQRNIRPNSQGTQTPAGSQPGATAVSQGNLLMSKPPQGPSNLSKLVPANKATVTSSPQPILPKAVPTLVKPMADAGTTTMQHPMLTIISTDPPKIVAPATSIMTTITASKSTASTSTATTSTPMSVAKPKEMVSVSVGSAPGNVAATTAKQAGTAVSTNNQPQAKENSVAADTKKEKTEILTHLIDGFKIEESSSPFPINRLVLHGLEDETAAPSAAAATTASTSPLANGGTATSTNTAMDNAIKQRCLHCKQRSRIFKKDGKRVWKFCSQACFKEYRVNQTKPTEASKPAAGQTSQPSLQPGVKKILSPKKQPPPMAAQLSVASLVAVPMSAASMASSAPMTANSSNGPALPTTTFARIQSMGQQQQQQIFMSNANGPILTNGYPAYYSGAIRMPNATLTPITPMQTLQTIRAPTSTPQMIGVKTSSAPTATSCASMLNGVKRPASMMLNGVSTATVATSKPQATTSNDDKRSRTIPPYDFDNLSDSKENGPPTEEVPLWVPPGTVTPKDWNVDQVCQFVGRNIADCDYSATFRNQVIDGQALFLIRDPTVAMQLEIKLGPALKILNLIERLRRKFDL